MENLVLVTFEEPGRAYQGISELRRLDGQRALTVRSAAVIERAPDGSFRVADDAETIGVTGTAVGGAVGALIGALAGPLGLLLGGMAGVAVGSLADAEEADTAEVLVSTVARRVAPGATALVVDVDEPAPELLDSVMRSLGGISVRWSRQQIEAELAVAAEALEAAQKEAKRVMRERRKAEGNETLGDKLSELKDKVSRDG